MKPKGRPKKIRRIGNAPKIHQFSPRGRPGRPDEIGLTLDQLETIKLADLLGLDQTKGAESMGISRSSFGRTLRQARALIADAIVNGKIIRVVKGDPAIVFSVEAQESSI